MTDSDSPRGRGVIRSHTIRRVDEPVLVQCSQPGEDGAAGTMTVIPMMDDDRVAGLEVRCRCGGSVIIECVYEEQG